MCKFGWKGFPLTFYAAKCDIVVSPDRKVCALHAPWQYFYQNGEVESTHSTTAQQLLFSH